MCLAHQTEPRAKTPHSKAMQKEETYTRRKHENLY